MYFLRIEWFLDSSFTETGIPFTQGCFVPSLVENGCSGGEDFQILSMFFRNYFSL